MRTQPYFIRALSTVTVLLFALASLTGCVQSTLWEPYPRSSSELTLPDSFEQFHFDRMNGDVALYSDSTRHPELRVNVSFQSTDFTDLGNLTHDMDPFKERRIESFIICGPKANEPGTDFCRIAVQDGVYSFNVNYYFSFTPEEKDALALEFWEAVEAASAR